MLHHKYSGARDVSIETKVRDRGRAGVEEQTGRWLGPLTGGQRLEVGPTTQPKEPRHVTTHKFRKPTRLKFTCWTSRLRSSTPRQTQDNDLRPPSSDQLPIMSLVSGEKVCIPKISFTPTRLPWRCSSSSSSSRTAHRGRFGHSHHGAPSRTLRPFQRQSDDIGQFPGASAGFDDHGAGMTGSAARRRCQHEREMGTSSAGRGHGVMGRARPLHSRPSIAQHCISSQTAAPTSPTTDRLPREDEDSHTCTGICTPRKGVC